MPKIRFNRDELYESEGRNKGPAFAKDEEIVCTDGFANRWAHRGSAEIVGRGEPAKGELFERVAALPPAEPAVDPAAAAAAQAAAAAAQAAADAAAAAAAAQAEADAAAAAKADAKTAAKT